MPTRCNTSSTRNNISKTRYNTSTIRHNTSTTRPNKSTEEAQTAKIGLCISLFVTELHIFLIYLKNIVLYVIYCFNLLNTNDVYIHIRSSKMLLNNQGPYDVRKVIRPTGYKT